jgi:hypothetical protein
MAPPFHRIQGRENLLVYEVASGPEEDEGVGVRKVHELLLHRPPSAFGHSRNPPMNAFAEDAFIGRCVGLVGRHAHLEAAHFVGD